MKTKSRATLLIRSNLPTAWLSANETANEKIGLIEVRELAYFRRSDGLCQIPAANVRRLFPYPIQFLGGVAPIGHALSQRFKLRPLK